MQELQNDNKWIDWYDNGNQKFEFKSGNEGTWNEIMDSINAEMDSINAPSPLKRMMICGSAIAFFYLI